jgi:hypothetical protein
MKKRVLVIFISFLFFVKPNLSFAENWEPILQVSPILTKNIDLLQTRMNEVLNQLQGLQEKYHKNLKTIRSFRTALPIEVCFKSLEEMFKYDIEYAKMQKEYTYLKQLMNDLISLQGNILTIQLLLTYNPNLKGSESIKKIIKIVIDNSLTLIKKTLKDEDLSYESSSVVRKIKSDLEEVLVILQ